MLGLCILHLTGTVIVGWCYGDQMRCAHGLVSIYYLTVSTHYSSGALIPECNGLSQFKEDTGGPSVPVREINFLAYLPLVQPTENHPDLDLNPGCRSRQPVRPSWLWMQ